MMVERMARAMFPHFWAANMEDPRGPEVLERYREDARDKARAALHAMREPTDAMIDAGVDAKRALYERMEAAGENTRTMVVAKHPAGTIYVAMIDAALKDEA